MSFIEVENLVKEYKIYESKPGVKGAIESLLHRKYRTKLAVNNISFKVNKSDIVGFIGPNGAGKSTTIKMLSGILVPTSGNITVGDINPYMERKKNTKRIGVVFGQRSQLYWDLPVYDTFELYKRMYDIPTEVFNKNYKLYTEIFEMGDFIKQPVRQLSLGQKMKANVAIALLHNPEVLYLDEPTIGLDVVTKHALRESIKSINKEKETTIILTTHDMDDIEAISNRLILINSGEKIYDGNILDFKEKYDRGYKIKVIFDRQPEWDNNSKYILENCDNYAWTLRTRYSMPTKEIYNDLYNKYNPVNIFIEDTQIEDIVATIFSK